MFVNRGCCFCDFFFLSPGFVWPVSSAGLVSPVQGSLCPQCALQLGVHFYLTTDWVPRCSRQTLCFRAGILLSLRGTRPLTVSMDSTCTCLDSTQTGTLSTNPNTHSLLHTQKSFVSDDISVTCGSILYIYTSCFARFQSGELLYCDKK